MYGPPGRAYVYLVYGMHDCLNLVTEPAGSPAALLVRAVAPIEGIDAMRRDRDRRVRARTRRTGGTGAITPAHRLAAGPGLVCAAFDLDRSLTGADLLDPGSAVRLEPPPDGEPPPRIHEGPRIGVDYAGPPWTAVPWRRWVAGDPSVSRPDRADRQR
jgi:DNA-3-methyladenine glycosylase